MWILQRGEATSADQFRDLLRTIDWNQTLYPGANVRVDITGKVAWVKDSRFAGQLVMDAIRDQASVANRPRRLIKLLSFVHIFSCNFNYTVDLIRLSGMHFGAIT